MRCKVLVVKCRRTPLPSLQILTIISRKNEAGELGIRFEVACDFVKVRRDTLSFLGILNVTNVNLEDLLLGIKCISLITKLLNQCQILFIHVRNVTLFDGK